MVLGWTDPCFEHVLIITVELFDLFLLIKTFSFSKNRCFSCDFIMRWYKRKRVRMFGGCFFGFFFTFFWRWLF